MQHSISTRLALCSLVLLLGTGMPQAQPWRSSALPDPASFGTRMEMGDIGQAREWLDAGLDPDYLADRIGTGLMIAAWRGDIQMMELFVARGADMNRTNAYGERALMHAAWRGQLEAVRWLLAKGAKVNSEPMRWSALHYAVFAGHGEVAAALLEQGADLNARSTNGSSVLMMAVYENHEPLVRQLLARGADRSLKNDRGDGALEWAFKFKHLAIARLVATPQQFTAAANQPKARWGDPVRSQPLAATAAPGPASETAGQIEELLSIREILAARRMTAAVRKLDQRIAALRAREPKPPAESARGSSPRLSEIDDLMNIRGILASRGLSNAVTTLDRRIAALRAQRAKAHMDVPSAALLEITASRASPDDQTIQLIIDSRAPMP